MKLLAGWIKTVIESKGNEATLAKIKANVKELCSKFPLYGHR